MAARHYGEDIVNFFHQRAVENSILEQSESPDAKERRLLLCKINPYVRVYEWAEDFVTEGNFLILTKFERIYESDSSRLAGVQDMFNDTSLLHTFDCFHNELHFVSTEDTFSPPPVHKYRQYHPDFACNDDELACDNWIQDSSRMRDVVNREGALQVAYYRLAFHGRPSYVGREVDNGMWSLVFDKLQCDAPALSDIPPEMARSLWQFLDSFGNTMDGVITSSQLPFVGPAMSRSLDPFPLYSGLIGPVCSLVYFYATNEIDDIRQAGLRHHDDSGDGPNVEARTARSYMRRGLHSNIVMIGPTYSATTSRAQPASPTSTYPSRDCWKLVVTAGIDALHACTLIKEGEGIVDVALELCKRGVPFKTVVWAGYVCSGYRVKAKPIRFDGHIWNAWDYHEYLKERTELLRIPWIRRACYMAGGILWRIAVDVAGPPNRSVFESGPSEASIRGEHACNIRGWVDDELPEDVVALIVGLYLCPQRACHPVTCLFMFADVRYQSQLSVWMNT